MTNATGFKRVLEFIGIQTAEQIQPDSPIQLNEAEALLRFVAERQMDGTPKLVKNLSETITDIRGKGSTVVPGQSREWNELTERYKALVDISETRLGVTGRTILESRHQPLVSGITIWLLAFLVAANVGIPAVKKTILTYGITESQNPILFSLYDMLAGMSPFFWGGVGASLYLLKALSDRAANSQFDIAKQQGTWPRIILGAVLGWIVVKEFHLSVSIGDQDIGAAKASLENQELTGAAIAFLAGLGQKAVFDVFEAIIRAVSKFVKGKGKFP